MPIKLYNVFGVHAIYCQIMVFPILLIISSTLAGFGSATRGQWSVYLAGLFSFITIGLMIYSFFVFDLLGGVISVISGLAIFNIAQRLTKSIFFK